MSVNWKRRIPAVSSLVMVCGTLAACSSASSSGSHVSSSSTGAATTQSSAAAKGPVILIGDQPFGDHGPMDDMAAGLQTCASADGLKVKKTVALTPSDYTSSIQQAAQSGYKLIITTFPEMATATATAARANPGVKFAAVYQDINDVGKAKISNLWDSSFDERTAAYAEGVIAAKLSKSGHLGFIPGDLDPTIAAELNAFAAGAKSVKSTDTLSWANANTFTDPATGKELAQSMISHGVDVIVTAAGQTQLGALAAAKAAHILFIGDNGDNASQYPTGFVSDLRSELGKNVIAACKAYAHGTFPGGTHIVYNLKNGGADLPTAPIIQWGKASGKQKEAAALVATYHSVVNQISAGKVKVPTSTKLPKSAT